MAFMNSLSNHDGIETVRLHLCFPTSFCNMWWKILCILMNKLGQMSSTLDRLPSKFTKVQMRIQELCYLWDRAPGATLDVAEFLGTFLMMKYHDCWNHDYSFCLALSYQDVSSIFQGYYDSKGVIGNLSC